MFKVDKTPTFSHTIPVNVPVDGGHEKQTMRVTFRLVDDETTAKHRTDTMAGQKEFLRLAIVKIDDLADPKKEPISYNDDVRDSILGLPYARNALLKGYSDGIVPGLLGN